MKKGLKRAIAIASAVTMLGGTVGALAACKKTPEDEDDGKVTYNTYTTQLPSNWNELTYEDNNDTQILDYISNSLFTYDYKFDETKGGKYTADGKVNVDAIVLDDYSVDYNAATGLKDVTASVDSKWGYTAEQKAAGGYAYQITIRNDLKWDDGTAIDVDDFIYSMKAQLDPDFLNFRANSYYQQIQIKNAKNYFYNGTYGAENLIVDATDIEYRPMSGFTKDPTTGRLSVTEDGQKYDIVFQPGNGAAWSSNGLLAYYNAYFKPFGTIAYILGYYDEPVADDYKEDGEWVEGGEAEFNKDHAAWEAEKDDLAAIKTAVESNGSDQAWKDFASKIVPAVQTSGDATGYVYMTEEYAEIIKKMIANLQGCLSVEEYAEDAKEIYYDASDATKHINYSEVEWQEFCFKARKWAEMDFAEVGYYKVDDYNFVVCMDTPIALLKGDGQLSWQAAYYMSGFPLVHEQKYEANKKEPQAGSTLYTSTYNSSVESTASWGPYKLTQFQSGKSYVLEKNEYWFGWNMPQYKDQYQIDKIECELVDAQSSTATAWLGFLSGDFDTVGIDVTHANFSNSKYSNYAPGSGTFFFQVYGNLDVLKESDNNNGILAIQDFRRAISLAFDREDYGAKTSVASLSNYGMINDQYYSDIDSKQQYRHTEQAKATLLRAWGYTENNDGTWSLSTNPNITNYTTDQAYNTIGGNNLTLAKQCLNSAYTELTTNAEKYGYDNTKKIKIIVGCSAASTGWRRVYDYFVNEVWGKLAEDSPLKDIVEITYAEKGSSWATAQRSGETQLFLGGGMSGNPLNPFDIIGAYLDPTDNLNFHPYWTETQSDSLEIKLPDVDYSKTGWTVTADKTLSMSPYNWYTCLNARADTDAKSQNKYNFGEGVVDSNARLTILAALEKYIIDHYYSIPSESEISASMLGAQFSYLQTEEYNVFMGFGGMRYMRVNYTDKAWEQFVKDNGNDLTNEYLKTE